MNTNGSVSIESESEKLHCPAITTRQFNFARHWRKKIAPHLNDLKVVHALTFGLKLWQSDYMPGKPPCHVGNWHEGHRRRRGCLSWYQPRNRCHHIAPFCWALGTRLYPSLKWGFISGEKHTVVVGWSHDWRRPEWVMDILLFREYSAEMSLNFAMQGKWEFYPSFRGYLDTFGWENVEDTYEAVDAILLG